MRGESEHAKPRFFVRKRKPVLVRVPLGEFLKASLFVESDICEEFSAEFLHALGIVVHFEKKEGWGGIVRGKRKKGIWVKIEFFRGGFARFFVPDGCREIFPDFS